MNLPHAEAIILEQLVDNGEMYGLELVRADKRIKRGGVYVLLGRMEDKGLVIVRKGAADNRGGLPRHYYQATKKGREILTAYRAMQAANEEG